MALAADMGALGCVGGMDMGALGGGCGVLRVTLYGTEYELPSASVVWSKFFFTDSLESSLSLSLSLSRSFLSTVNPSFLFLDSFPFSSRAGD